MWLPLFLLLLLLGCCSHHQRLIAQADDRTVLMKGNKPCEGYVGIVHNGELGYVGVDLWDDNVSKVVCSSIQCGNALKSFRTTNPKPEEMNKSWINGVKCTGKEAQLWDCRFPGFGVSQTRDDALQYIECSHKIEIGLEGFQCAGAVQYSVDGGNKYSGYICADGWKKEYADVLCQTLKCGTAKEVVNEQWMGWKAFQEKKKMMVDCLGIGNFSHLWQCATKESSSCPKPASVICTGHEKVQLRGNKSNVCSGKLVKEESGKWTTFQNNITDADKWCQQMNCGTSSVLNGTVLTCSDNVKVVLVDNNNNINKCYGTVAVQVNDKSHHVCGSSWNMKDAEVVCKELGCGKVHHSKTVQVNTKGIMDNVQCSGNEASLWHCRAKRDHNTFLCPSRAYVVCTGSVEVKLRGGPGRCSGRVEIQHEGKWKRVIKQVWTDENFDAVCKLLACGNKRNILEEFSQGSAEFLNGTLQCKKNVKHISECIEEAPNTRIEKKAMAITCEEHKVVFLKGNESCSGLVGIEQGPKTYWLSGSNETWNMVSANIVCQQMHCGKVSNHTSTNISDVAVRKSIWKESYNCSVNNTSLFDCQKNLTLSSDHEDTIATVTCMGKVTVNLTQRCWGNVNICLGDKCGGVCSKGWTTQKAAMLCKDLGCGNTVLEATTKPDESHEMIIASVHSTSETTNLTQCNFVTNDENDSTCKRNPAYVICSGSIETKFSDLRDHCSGHVEMKYEGKWMPVCADALKETNVQDTICGELKCGQALKRIDYFGPKAVARSSISEINCTADGHRSLAACIMKSQQSTCDPGVLKCSGWSKIALAVHKACSGAAIVLSGGKDGLQGERMAISFENWTKEMGEMLCKHLECGQLNQQNKTQSSLRSLSFNCATGKHSKSIWDCERKVNNSQTEQLFIECKDEPKITLSKGCYGEVKIENSEVCDTHWKPIYSDRVCSEQNCGGKAIYSPNNGTPTSNNEYYHVRCDEHHYQLGQCKRFKEKCKGKPVSVYCVDNVKFKTTEKCGGQVLVQYRDKWEKVCYEKLDDSKKKTDYLGKLCPEIACSGYASLIKDDNDQDTSGLETTLQCTGEEKDIKYCLRYNNQPCESRKPARIVCNGYEPPPVYPPITPTPAWPTILAVGFALAVVILITVFLRICIVRRAKKGRNVSPGKLEEDGCESGNFEELMSKSNEMEELNHTRFRSKTEANDEVSVSSFAYDDIDEVAAALPLTSRADTAGASDGPTLEVDDQEESYDDIEACYQITETEAEIHDATPTAPEGDAAPPTGSELRGDNNLVPRRVSQS
ncbi:uncharacterized protein ACO6RY_04539 [Pungitius sinensis]